MRIKRTKSVNRKCIGVEVIGVEFIDQEKECI